MPKISISKEKRETLIIKLVFTITAILGFSAFFAVSLTKSVDGLSLGQNGTVVYIISLITLLAAALFFTFKINFKSHISFLCVLMVAVAAICLRLFMLDFASGDYGSFLSVWVSQMKGMSFREAITTPIGDYNMPYLYFLAIFSRFKLNDLYLIKLLSIVFDFVLALAVTKLISLFKKGDGTLVLSFALTLFAPTFFLNSAYWGQCDVIYTALCVIALYFAFKDKGAHSVVFFALAFSFKIQSIFILPIIIFLIIKRKISFTQILLFPVTFFATLLPAILCGRSFYDTFSIYINQTSSYPYLTLNCPTLWALIPDNQDNFAVFGTGAVLLAGAAVLVFSLFVYLKKENLNKSLLFDCAFIFTLIIPFLLPRMHERYFYLAETLSIIYVFLHKDRIFVAPVLNLTGFCVYSAYLFGNGIINLEILSIINAVIIIYVLKKFYDDLYSKQTKPTKKECF